MALAGAALILKVEDERSPYQALILNLSEQYGRGMVSLKKPLQMSRTVRVLLKNGP